MATYTCKWCGQQNPNPAFVQNTCFKSPHKKHELMNATEKLSQYTCKWCGQQNSNPAFVQNTCFKSPHKTHELLG